jgi:hypothetical protein
MKEKEEPQESGDSISWKVLIFFFLIYFTQNCFLGFVWRNFVNLCSYYSFLNTVYLLEEGIEIEKIGIFSFISLLPMVLKVIIGVLGDKWGKRKIWIAAGLVIQVCNVYHKQCSV